VSIYQLNEDVLQAFNEYESTIMFIPRTTGVSQQIMAIFSRAPIEEPAYPGTTGGVASAGASIVYLWVHFAALTPQPALGDNVSINGIPYDVGAVYVDVKGGATLRLGRNL
jgi:hypothetical protein